ncbi:hypothetical protein OBBRIDRAFT_834738 [Obba rivulosa]|uniref:Uncharacterized protein n=1 Tax=Obba rivulosa TaxID=1052685 RepID=A0A8E2AUU9_9APHY|nr:hypothetical protein OBBRIDRAFT_834738 [Obba rivulosa]
MTQAGAYECAPVECSSRLPLSLLAAADALQPSSSLLAAAAAAAHRRRRCSPPPSLLTAVAGLVSTPILHRAATATLIDLHRDQPLQWPPMARLPLFSTSAPHASGLPGPQSPFVFVQQVGAGCLLVFYSFVSILLPPSSTQLHV